MTADPTDPTPAGDPPEGEPTKPAEPAAPPETETAEAAAVTPEPATASSTFPPGSLFQDRPLTPVEAKRLDVARIQPKPWQPTDDILDPNSDKGWEQAADHELIAIRPEDVAVPEYQTAQQAAAPAAPVAPLPSNPIGPSTAALSWAKAASAAPPVPAAPLLFPPAAADAAAVASTAPAMAPVAVGAGVATPDQVAADVALAPSERRWTRGVRKARSGAAAGLRPVMLLGLFVIGIALGFTTFVRNQPVPEPAIPAAQPADNGTSDKVPPQIASLIAALSADNQTEVQVVVPAQPYRLLAGELAVDGISQILGARALATYTVGNDSATEILITGVDPSGNAVTFNLVVHMHNGVISDFR
jgi:hypothetical protein